MLDGLRAGLADKTRQIHAQQRRVSGEWHVDAELEQTFARIFFGAMSSSGAAVSTADDADTEAERVELAIGFILAGLRSLADQGVQMPATPSAGATS